MTTEKDKEILDLKSNFAEFLSEQNFSKACLACESRKNMNAEKIAELEKEKGE